MSQVIINVSDVGADARSAFVHQLSYASDAIEGIEKSRSEIVITVSDDAVDAVRERAQALLGKLVAETREIPTTVWFESAPDADYPAEDVFPEMLARDWVVEFTPGLIGVGGPFQWKHPTIWGLGRIRQGAGSHVPVTLPCLVVPHHEEWE